MEQNLSSQNRNGQSFFGQLLRALLRILFVLFGACPVVLLWLGIHVRHRERLPLKGPAIIAANHNSHLDILTLLSLFPLLSVPNVQAVAASDYFFRNRWLKWFALYLIGIVPVTRSPGMTGRHPLQDCFDALAAGKILIIFPEGTRSSGEFSEHMAALKPGIWYLGKRFPEVPVIPIYLHGLGKSMPKGSKIPLPLFIRIAIGQPLAWIDNRDGFIGSLTERLLHLREKVFPASEATEDDDGIAANAAQGGATATADSSASDSVRSDTTVSDSTAPDSAPSESAVKNFAIQDTALQDPTAQTGGTVPIFPPP
jgi:1-acyl-sn-glycerol-3-phosphate acyltransferase